MRTRHDASAGDPRAVRRRLAISSVPALALSIIAWQAWPSAGPVRETRTVRVTEGTELAARLSPDGRRIAFILLGDVFVIDRQGGAATRVTDAARQATVYSAVAWSPDSRRLVVSHGPRVTSEARVVDLATGNAHVVVPRSHNGVTWTPDGRAILAAIPRGDSTLLVAYAVDGDDSPARLGAVPGNRGYLTYAPDGGHVAFGPTLSEFAIGSGRHRVLADSVPGSSQGVYSPDGSLVAFLAERSGTRQVWVAPRTGGAPRQVTHDVDDVYDTPVSWTPDGRRILYTAAGQIRLASVDGGPEETVGFNASLTVSRWIGHRRVELPRPGVSRRARGVVHPQLSPDGRRLVFGALGDLWVATVDGGTTRRLTSTPWADETFPRWAPDGERIVYVEDVLGQDRRLRILAVDSALESGAVSPEPSRMLAAPPLLGQAVQWSPDGQKLAFFAGDAIGWIDVTTGRVQILAHATRSYDHLLGWTVDGGSIVFATVRVAADSVGGFYATHTPRSVAITDSGLVRPWPFRGTFTVRGAWTPDHAWAAFDSAGRGYYLRVAEPTPRAIPDPAPRYFSWSADGRRLLYLSGSRLRLLDVVSGRARTLDVGPVYHVAPAPPPLVIRQVRIIDGHGTAPTAPVDVFVANGRITRIVPAGRVTLSKRMQVIDGTGHTLLPGLFDMHVHHTDGGPIPPSYAYHGVLAIRDLGTHAEWMQAQRERSEAGGVMAPRVFLSGGLMVTDVGQGLESTLRDHREVDAADPTGVAQHVAALRDGGSDVLKFNIKDARLEANASRAAHRRGLPVTSHYVFASTLAEGLDGKEHMQLYTGTTGVWRQDLVAVLRAAGTCVTPTLSTHAYSGLRQGWSILPQDSTFLDEPATQAFASPAAIEWVRSTFRTSLGPTAFARRQRLALGHLASVRRLRDAGVPLLSGTDAGVPGLSLGVELELLVEAGLTPLEAIRAATLASAQCLGVDHALGSVEVGKAADLILVDGDPSTDIAQLRRITRVVLGGQAYTRDEILSAMARHPPAVGPRP